MKCDELKEYYYYEDRVVTPSTHLYRVYHADKVDKVIAEKDAEIAELKKFEGVGHRMKGGHRHNHIYNVLQPQRSEK